ncbi:uncharacterized protein [Haliotis cracherodii]|uniref:uncharacterized protein n=1 Tax=Haliotis cracherodii TaxID=6455 RepID=UPI0039EAC5F3
MSTRIIRQTRDPFEALERMLNRTTLDTQRVAHGQIIELGGRMLTVQTDDSKEEREKAIQDAVDAAEARATRELRAALKRMKDQKDAERRRALQTQKEYFERLAQRVSEQRDRAEEERIKELTKKLQKEKEEALKQQWEDCERLKEIAIADACTALRKSLRNEFALEKERAVAQALKAAREMFKKREEEVIAFTTRQCEERARQEAERVARLHQQEVNRLNQKYDNLETKYHRELAHRQRVEDDFRALQDDYRRFMDYTDGKFHSDYLMSLRYQGMLKAQKKISEVTYEDLSPKHGTRNSIVFL